MAIGNSTSAQKLNLFDVTNLVVGGAIGADIYIISALGSAYLGPASLLVFVVAGAIAIIIALSFAEAAALVPKVGGRLHTYVRRGVTLPVSLRAGPSGLQKSPGLPLCRSPSCSIFRISCLRSRCFRAT